MVLHRKNVLIKILSKTMLNFVCNQFVKTMHMDLYKVCGVWKPS